MFHTEIFVGANLTLKFAGVMEIETFRYSLYSNLDKLSASTMGPRWVTLWHFATPCGKCREG